MFQNWLQRRVPEFQQMYECKGWLQEFLGSEGEQGEEMQSP